MRASKEDQLKALKVGSYRLVDACGDGLVVPMTRVKASALSKYKAVHDLEHFMPVDVVLDLELVAGYPILTEVMARLHGKRLVSAERDPAESCVVAVRESLEAVEDDTARLRLTIREAVADGKLDQAEKIEIRRKLDQLRKTIDDLEELL